MNRTLVAGIWLALVCAGVAGSGYAQTQGGSAAWTKGAARQDDVRPAEGDEVLSAAAIADQFSQLRNAEVRATRSAVTLRAVQFVRGSAELTPNAREQLDQLAKALAFPELAGRNFTIEGHTDTTGTDAINLPLSRARAQSVVAYLSAQGVDASRLNSLGFGATRLKDAANGPAAVNRRVEVVLNGVW